MKVSILYFQNIFMYPIFAFKRLAYNWCRLYGKFKSSVHDVVNKYSVDIIILYVAYDTGNIGNHLISSAISDKFVCAI